MKQPIEGQVYILNELKGNKYRVMSVRPDGKFKKRVFFANLKTGQTGSLELGEFMNNFKLEEK